MKKLDFIKLNPAGNMTVLIENYDINSDDILKISEIMMSETNLYAEQVGFIHENHLRMMGGEFCGNASRAFASLLAFRDKDFYKQKNYLIGCSGEKELLEVDVREGKKENEFLAKIKMPNYIAMKELKFKDRKLILIEFLGIKHFIYEEEKSKIKKEITNKKRELIEFIKKYLGQTEYSAFGLMFYGSKDNFMLPYIHVKGFENGIWENSCASGTTALGFYLKKYKNINEAKIKQPNGWLEFSFKDEEIYIDGPVEIVAEGKVYI